MKRLEGGYLGSRPTWSLASNPGVWAMEQVYARRVAGLWPVGSGSFDEYYEYVTLLLHMNGSNGSTTFADSSLRNLAVTAVSSSITTSQSKFDGASGNFVRSSGGRLNISTTNNEFVFGAGDFTIEAWIYLNSMPGTGYPGSYWITGWGAANSDAGCEFYLTTTNIVFNLTAFSAPQINVAHNMVTGQWYHVAIARNGTTLRAFVNGQEKASGTSTAEAAIPSYGSAIAISSAEPTGASTGGNFDGYIDDLRITKGYCRYASNFSVPTAAFENDGPAISDPFYDYVSLLLAMNGNNNSTVFTDKSPSALTITASGDAKLSTADKRYGISSAYFDGTGDYITAPNTTGGFTFGAGDFTYEWWFKSGATNGYSAMLTRPYSGAGGILISLNGATGDGAPEVYWREWTNGLFFKSSITGLNDNKWHHFAFVRSGTTVYMFIDGVQAASKTSVSTSVGSSSVIIGQDIEFAGRTYTGYIDDVRITKGVARYIANFIPPLPHADYGVLADPYLSSASLWMPMEGAINSSGFFDRADRLTITPYGNSKISNAQYKWGSTSAYFDGSGDYLRASSQPTFGTNDFTIEFWVYPVSTTGLQGYIDFRPAQGVYPCIYQTGGTLNYYVSTGDRISSANAVTAGKWHHIALARRGTSTKLFCNGIQVGSTYSDSNSYAAPSFYMGTTFDGYYANAYFDDVRVTNGTALYVNNFAPPAAPINSELSIDPYFSNVSLLLKMDGANNSTTFTDSSLTPKAVLAKGNAKISTTQSKFSGSSAYFDGVSSTYLAIPAVGLPIGAGDFTIEMWANFANPSAYQYFCASSSMTGGYFQMALNGMASNAIGIGRTNVDWPLVFSGHNMVANTWYHIAICRANGVARCFINGNQIGSSITDSTNFTIGVSEFHIGHQDANGTMTGYLDDFRLTNAARYTANFLPPTISHPVWSQADENFGSVSLLLNGNGTNASTVVADRSSNALTLVPVDGAQISTTQSRFGGSSLYFDGTLDRFVIATNPVLNFSTGDFTIELWAYHTSFASNKFYISSEATGGLFFGQYSATQIGWGRANVAWDATPTHSMTVNTWYHIALTRSGSDMKLFVNGSQIGSTSSSLAYDLSATATNIGSQTANYYHSGYLDDIRVTKGVARYTANFTPPAAPHPIPTIDPYFGAVSLLLHMNGANASTYFPDHSYNALAVTANGNAQISTAQSKFGGSSALFDGTGDDLRIASPPDALINWYSTDYTLEYWIRCTAFPAASGSGSSPVVVGNMSNSADTNYWSFGPIGDGKIRFYYYNGGPVSFTTASSMSLNTWTHLAFVKSGTGMTIYIDGVSSATATVSGTPQSLSATGFGIGQYVNVSFNGYIDDIRITKGVARYTSAFTPPTAQFANS